MPRRPWTFGLIKPDAIANPISLECLLKALYHRGLSIEEGNFFKKLFKT